LYYSKQQFFAAVPFIIVAISFGGWYLCGKMKNQPFFQKRTKKDQTTTKDKFVVTVITVLYLLYPTLCKNTFGLFDCKTIGAQAYLRIDLEEKCYQGRHQTMMVLLGVGQLIVYIIGLPLITYVFLHRNRDSLQTHCSQARYGLFYGAYKTDCFFWETIITTRKMSVVMLSVFGPELGPEKQTQVALLLLLICIVLEIYGDPYLIETPKHKILSQLELSALLIEWGTMWSGLMIFQLDESKPSDKSFAVVLTVLIVLTNTALLICFVVQFVRAKTAENKEQARLDALKGEKRGSFFSDGLSALRNRFGSHAKEEGDVEMIGFKNPMQEKGIKKDAKKGNSTKMNKSKFPEHLIVTGEPKSKKKQKKQTNKTKEKKEKKEKKETKETKPHNKTKASETIHKDAKTGRRYSHNGDTGVTNWLADEKEKSAKKEMNTTQIKTSTSIHKDAKTGRRYSHNGDTGVTKWLADEKEKSAKKEMNTTQIKTSTSIHKDVKTGRRYSHNGDTGVTKWLADEKEKSEKNEMNKTQPKTSAFKQRQRSSFMTSSAEVDLVSSVDTHVDKATGRRYSINAKTGMSEWLDKAVAEEAMHVDPTTGRRYNSKGWL
jgi:hypothetical protein